MNTHRNLLLFLSLLLLPLKLFATAPLFKLMASSGLTHGTQLPPMSFPVNSSPVINAAGHVLFSVPTLNGEGISALWAGNSQQGKVILQSQAEEIISDPVIGDTGNILFDVSDEHKTRVIYQYDQATQTAKELYRLKNFYGMLRLKDYFLGHDQTFYFKGTDYTGKNTLFKSVNGGMIPLISEVEDEQAEAGISYLFTPSFNSHGQSAVKVRLGKKWQWDENRPDEIWINDHEGKVISKIADQDSSSESAFLSFHNTVAINTQGNVVFVATHSDHSSGLYLYHLAKKESQLIATTRPSKLDLSEIELFAPALNSQNQIAFRAINQKGQRGIYFFNGHETLQLVGESTLLPTEQGEHRIYAEKGHPAFAGSVSLNEKGQIAFATTTYDPGHHNETYAKAIYTVEMPVNGTEKRK